MDDITVLKSALAAIMIGFQVMILSDTVLIPENLYFSISILPIFMNPQKNIHVQPDNLY